jgi:hypothetical protein
MAGEERGSVKVRRCEALGFISCFVAAALALGACSPEDEDIAIDCEWRGRANAWIDEDKNGTRNANEPPLQGVEFFVDDVTNRFTDVGEEAVSNEKGSAELYVFLPDCPRVDYFEVYAEPPSGYQETTQSRIRAHLDSDKPFSFGFAKR